MSYFVLEQTHEKGEQLPYHTEAVLLLMLVEVKGHSPSFA